MKIIKYTILTLQKHTNAKASVLNSFVFLRLSRLFACCCRLRFCSRVYVCSRFSFYDTGSTLSHHWHSTSFIMDIEYFIIKLTFVTNRANHIIIGFCEKVIRERRGAMVTMSSKPAWGRFIVSTLIVPTHVYFTS